MSQLSFDLSPQRQVFTVSELTATVRAILDTTFPDVWVAGEISNARLAPSGHYYFTLKDASCQLKAVCFRSSARFLKLQPKDGLAVLARGRLGVYEARGEYQLYVEYLEPQGHGALQLAFEQLRRRLDEEGLFDDSRKKPLPVMPRRIGIVTSRAGAALADVLRILERRFSGLHIQLYPAQVQGEGAAAEIADGLRYFSQPGAADVVIVGRGGGSMEDLWAFNEEPVARAIAECRVPVISAVGHQTDFTIADFVADVRAPTPSAAAELVIGKKTEFLEQLRSFQARLAKAIRYRLAITGGQLIERSIGRGAHAMTRKLAAASQRTDELDFRIRQAGTARASRAAVRFTALNQRLTGLDLRVRLTRQRARFGALEGRLGPAMEGRLGRSGHRLQALQGELRHLSPAAVLERGYAIAQSSDGAILRSAGEVEIGERLRIHLNRGALGVVVNEKDPAQNPNATANE